MSGLRYDRILAGTALALVLALPGNALANTDASDPEKPAIQAAEPARALDATQGIGTDPVKPEAPSNITTAPAPEAPNTVTTAPAPATAAPAPAETVSTPAAVEAPVDALASLDPADRPIAEKLREILSNRLGRVITRKAERDGIEAFYRDRNFAPLWTDKGLEAARTASAVKYLKTVDADGLDPEDYRAPDFKAAQGDPLALAEAEIKMTATVMTYARHAENGRVHFSRVSADVLYNQEPPQPKDVLGKLAGATDVAAALDSYNPQQPAYKALKAKLAAARGGTQQEAEVVRIADGPTLRPGMDDARVPSLRERLKVSGDQSDTRYDSAVADAVKGFQRNAGLSADGLLGAGTVRALNGGPRRGGNQVDTILANMERWRWMPRDLGKVHVVLNIPDYTLRVYNEGAVVWQTKVVVGKPNTPTPILTETMKFITVNPTWNVPPSIVYNEYLPALQQDPTALSRIGVKVVQNRDGSLHMYQPPGDNNALGRIRFNFPNKFLVYQHDTPDKNLFKHDKRAYSHGCMRVEDPLKYAEVLLGLVLPNEKYTVERLRRMYGPSEQNIQLPTHIPVHITYQTAFVDDAGQLVIRDDIYGRDSRVLVALKGEDRRVADIAIDRPQPNYSRPAARLPGGVAFEGNGPGGPSFFERLFGGSQPAPARRQTRVVRPRDGLN
jgi:murein L,D-transpeptidase YcbB/YkuD